MFVVLFPVYNGFLKAKNAIIEIQRTVEVLCPEQRDIIYQVLITASDTDKVVGFMGPRESYDQELIVNGIEQSRRAIPYFRNRLDIHLGIVTVAEKIKRRDIVGDQLIEILKVSKEIGNQWVWGTINTITKNLRTS